MNAPSAIKERIIVLELSYLFSSSSYLMHSRASVRHVLSGYANTLLQLCNCCIKLIRDSNNILRDRLARTTLITMQLYKDGTGGAGSMYEHQSEVQCQDFSASDGLLSLHLKGRTGKTGWAKKPSAYLSRHIARQFRRRRQDYTKPWTSTDPVNIKLYW